MNHRIGLELISMYVDGRLPGHRHNAVASHIEGCLSCGNTVRMLRGYKAAVAVLHPVEESVTFDLQFRDKLNEALVARARPSPLAVIAERMLEDARALLVPRVPALVRITALVIVTISLGIGSYFYTSVENPIVVAMYGEATVSTPSGARALQSGQKIGPGSTISIQEGSSLDIEVSGKFAIRLKENSSVRIGRMIPKYRKGEVRIALNKGKALVRIDEGFKGSRFFMRTSAAEVKALGTKFAVDATEKLRKRTWVGVLEGAVEVAGVGRSQQAKKIVVKTGQMTIVDIKEGPAAPRRLALDEWRELEELYQIGKKLQVLLLVRNTADRAMEVLRPAPLYISDEEKGELPSLVKTAIQTINQAIEKNDINQHLESIRLLEQVVKEYPNPRYDPQLLLFIGAYYRFIGHYTDSIRTLERVVEEYPETTFASIAQCAIGIVFERDLKDVSKASEAYNTVLRNYPDSLEAIWIESNIKKTEAGRLS